MNAGRRIFRRPENCRWSAPACWPDPVSDRDDDFKTVWACEHSGTAVTADDCAHCPYWFPERGPVQSRVVALTAVDRTHAEMSALLAVSRIGFWQRNSGPALDSRSALKLTSRGLWRPSTTRQRAVRGRSFSRANVHACDHLAPQQARSVSLE
jgi:hypothetical protein